jgi:hypothetical protein
MTETTTRTPRRSRATSIALYALWVVVATTVLFRLMTVYTIVTGHYVFSFGGGDSRLPLSAVPQLIQADLRPGADGHLVDAPLWLRLLCASPVLIEAVIFTLGAVWLAQIIRRIAVADPFSDTPVRRWKQLSILLIVGGIVQGLTDTAALTAIMTLARMSAHEPPFPLGADYQAIGGNGLQWPMFTILLGIVAAALGLAFRAGSRLKEETEGVV